VGADIVADGHETVAAELLYGTAGQEAESVRLSFSGNDVYEGSFIVGDVGPWSYHVRAWVDMFATWQAVFKRRVDTGSPQAELKSELLEGAALS
jgi:starch synthase (maltosyl-transferring)